MLIIQHRTHQENKPLEEADIHEMDVQYHRGTLYFAHDQLQESKSLAVRWGAPADFPDRVILDFKESTWAETERLVDELRHLSSHRDIRVSSQSLHFLSTMKYRLPNLKLGWVFSYGSFEWSYLKELQPEFISVDIDVIEEQYVNIRSFDPDMKIFVYPVDSIKDAREMEQLGVDGIFTKHP